MSKTLGAALVAASCFAGAAFAQCANLGVPTLVNTGVEDANPDSPAEALGWHSITGTATWRTVGDGLSPTILPVGTLNAITPHAGNGLLRLTTLTAGGFGGFTTDTRSPLLPGGAFYDVNYDWVNGGDIEVGCWYMIPAATPIVGFNATFLGDAADLKTQVKVNCQPVATIEDFSPTSTSNMRGTTNDVWVKFTKHIKRRDVRLQWRGNAVDPLGCLCVPTTPDPSRVSITPGRFVGDGQPTTGTIYMDDFFYIQFCAADIDDGSATGHPDGGVDINDLLYFLSVFEGGSEGADLSSSDYPGVSDAGVDISDLLFFLEHFESGC
jgi:hypothetical protein